MFDKLWTLCCWSEGKFAPVMRAQSIVVRLYGLGREKLKCVKAVPPQGCSSG